MWLCMELMDVPLDKFYRVLHSEDRRIPENVLWKIAIDVCCKLICVLTYAIRWKQ